MDVKELDEAIRFKKVTDYLLPDPKEKPLDCLILAYKVTKGVAYDNRDWDKIHWARTARSAKQLLAICGGLRQADACMVEIAKGFEDKELSWTLETINKHAHEWIAKKRGGINVDINARRAGLFKAIADRSRGLGDSTLRSDQGALSDSVRDFFDTQATDDQDRPRLGDGTDGKRVDGVLPDK